MRRPRLGGAERGGVRRAGSDGRRAGTSTKVIPVGDSEALIKTEVGCNIWDIFHLGWKTNF